MSQAPLNLRSRREALGLSVADVAYAARVRAVEVVDPSWPSAVRIDAALACLEAGGCLDDARAASQPARRGPKPRGTKSSAPPWPEHSGAERLSGQCFQDMPTRRVRTSGAVG